MPPAPIVDGLILRLLAVIEAMLENEAAGGRAEVGLAVIVTRDSLNSVVEGPARVALVALCDSLAPVLLGGLSAEHRGRVKRSCVVAYAALTPAWVPSMSLTAMEIPTLLPECLRVTRHV